MSRHRAFLAIAAVAAVAACSAPATPDEALLRDLEQAQSASIELAPRAAGTKVVSAIESPPMKAPSTSAPAPQRTPTRRATPPAPAPTLAQAPEPVPAPPPAESPTTTAQAPAPTVTMDQPQSLPQQPARRGRYKTTAEVIRDAPFPILP